MLLNDSDNDLSEIGKMMLAMLISNMKKEQSLFKLGIQIFSAMCQKKCFETCKQKNNIWHLFLFSHFAFLFIKDFADDKYSFREHS